MLNGKLSWYENRRTPQDTIIKTTEHPNEQHECLETIYQNVLMCI